MAKKTPSDLKSILQAEKADALSAYAASKLAAERSDAMDYYNGDMTKDMPSAPGRSKAVSSDVADTVEGLMPSLVDIFTSGDEVVQFAPVSEEDVPAAEQETDYVNHVFLQQNPGFLILYSFIKDALISKVGVVKVSWTKDEKEERETYLDQPDDAFQMIAGSPDVDVIEHTEHPVEGWQPDPTQPDAPPPMLHDVTVVMKRTYESARIEGVPPEEFGIARNARSLRDCGYCFHEVLKTEADLIGLGYDEHQIKDLPSSTTLTSVERFARDTVDESMGTQGDESINRPNRIIRITEHYVRMDYENNGKPSLYRVTTGGDQNEILIRDGEPEIVPEDMIPFAAMTPVIVTHRFFGRSIADLVMDIQRIKTALLRGILDNAYLANNPRVEVAETYASPQTLDDLLVSRPGGIVRTKTPGGLNWQTVPNIAAEMFPMMEYMDMTREQRTGVTRQGQGLDANALQNQSATAANLGYTASQARMKLIAAIFAHTGIRDLFCLVHAIIRKHGSKPQTVRLRNKWVQVDPRDWKTRNDTTVNVGLGTGGKQQQLANLGVIANAQQQALTGGLTNLVTPSNLFNTGKEMVKLMGYKDVERFFTDPTTAPPPQQRPDPAMVKAQADMQAQQQQQQLAQQKSQFDTQHQIAKTQADMALAERKAQLQEKLMLDQHALDAEKHRMEMAMAITKHQQSMETSARKNEDGPKAAIEVKHGADQITGPIADVVAKLGEHLANNQAMYTQAIVGALAAHNKPKRIKGPSGKVYQIESVN